MARQLFEPGLNKTVGSQRGDMHLGIHRHSDLLTLWVYFATSAHRAATRSWQVGPADY